MYQGNFKKMSLKPGRNPNTKECKNYESYKFTNLQI